MRLWASALLAASLLFGCAAATPSPTPTASGSTVQPTPELTPTDAPAGVSTPAPEIEADSVTKIHAALDAGTIDHDTALVYELYASLDYGSLPVEYQSSNPAASDATPVLGELGARLDQLPAELKAKVAPFFLRPDDPDSFWQHRLSPTAAGTIKLAAFASAIPLESIDADSTPVRIWYASPLGTSERALAVQLADEMDRSNMWEKEKTAMLGHTPCTDNNLDHNGGSSRLDIYLVYPGTGLDWGGRTDQLGYNEENQPNNGVDIYDGVGDTTDGVTCPVATHIILNGGLDFEHLKSTTAHELFHSFQYTFKQSTHPDRAWWMEATATWAKDLVYPEQDFEQAYMNGYWSQHDGPEGPIDSTSGSAEYAAYILPFYLDQKSGDPEGKTIGQTWASSETQAPIDVLGALPGWSDKFKEFALWNWNKDTVAKYRDADRKIPEAKLSQNPTCMDSHIVRHGNANECLVKVGKSTLSISLDPTTVQYYEGIPDSPLVEKLTFDLADVRGKTGLAVQAILTIGSQNEVKVEDWSDLPTRSFCVESENLTKVVLVVSNSNVAPGQKVQGGIKIDANAAGCSGWRGTMSITTSWNVQKCGAIGYTCVGTTTSTFDGLWELAPDDNNEFSCRLPIEPEDRQDHTLDCLPYLPTGTITWTWNSHDQPGCSETSAGTLPAGAARFSALEQVFVLVPDGAGHYGDWGAGNWGGTTGLKCESPRGMGSPPSYFDLAQGDAGTGAADGQGGTCVHTTWLIDAAAETISGSCYDFNNGPNTQLEEWNLQKVGDAIPAR
jgi:hypothetical protein